MNNNLPHWITELNRRLPDLLENLSTGVPGQYRYCAKGDLIPPGSRAGLGFICFAAKTAMRCGIWDRLPEDHRKQWACFIQGFQLPSGSQGNGMFRDPTIEHLGGVELQTILPFSFQVARSAPTQLATPMGRDTSSDQHVTGNGRASTLRA